VHCSCDKNMLTFWKHDRKRVKSTMEYHSLFLRDVGIDLFGNLMEPS